MSIPCENLTDLIKLATSRNIALTPALRKNKRQLCQLLTEWRKEEDEVERQITSSSSYAAKRRDSLIAIGEVVAMPLEETKKALDAQKSLWPAARSLDKDVHDMCREFFTHENARVPEHEHRDRLALLGEIAAVFYGENVVDELDSSVTEPKKLTKKEERLASWISNVIWTRWGSSVRSGAEGKLLFKTASLCLLLSHPVVQETMKRVGAVKHLTDDRLASIRREEARVAKEFAGKAKKKQAQGTWGELIAWVANNVGSWLFNKKVILGALLLGGAMAQPTTSAGSEVAATSTTTAQQQELPVLPLADVVAAVSLQKQEPTPLFPVSSGVIQTTEPSQALALGGIPAEGAGQKAELVVALKQGTIVDWNRIADPDLSEAARKTLTNEAVCKTLLNGASFVVDNSISKCFLCRYGNECGGVQKYMTMPDVTNVEQVLDYFTSLVGVKTVSNVKLVADEAKRGKKVPTRAIQLVYLNKIVVDALWSGNHAVVNSYLWASHAFLNFFARENHHTIKLEGGQILVPHNPRGNWAKVAPQGRENFYSFEKEKSVREDAATFLLSQDNNAADALDIYLAGPKAQWSEADKKWQLLETAEEYVKRLQDEMIPWFEKQAEVINDWESFYAACGGKGAALPVGCEEQLKRLGKRLEDEFTASLAGGTERERNDAARKNRLRARLAEEWPSPLWLASRIFETVSAAPPGANVRIDMQNLYDIEVLRLAPEPVVGNVLADYPEYRNQTRILVSQMINFAFHDANMLLEWHLFVINMPAWLVWRIGEVTGGAFLLLAAFFLIRQYVGRTLLPREMENAGMIRPLAAVTPPAAAALQVAAAPAPVRFELNTAIETALNKFYDRRSIMSYMSAHNVEKGPEVITENDGRYYKVGGRYKTQMSFSDFVTLTNKDYVRVFLTDKHPELILDYLKTSGFTMK